MHMEKKVRKKRPQGSPPRKERRDRVKSGSGGSLSGSTSKKVVPVNSAHPGSAHNVLGISLDPESARQAVILSEIIGKPVSKRGRRR